MPEDDKPPMPAQPQTVSLPAVTDRALLEDLGKVVKIGFASVAADLETVKAEGQRTNLRLTRQEVRMDDVETRLANNSMRAQQTSSVDLDHEAKIAGVIVKTQALETAIHETRAIVAQTPTKEDFTKATELQTTAIVDGVTKLAEKSPILRALLVALAGLAFVAINAATTYLTTKATAQPAPQTQTVTVPR